MDKEQIKQRYKEVVLPANRDPYHFEVRPDDAVEIQACNPLCGDKYRLYLGEAESLKSIHYHGIGCALSKASGSLMIRALEGMDAQEAQRLVEEFLQQVATGKVEGDLPEDLRVLVELKNFEGREDCITLTWKALLEHLQTQTRK